jgi:orotidine-5'-phosphate decarboxylase
MNKKIKIIVAIDEILFESFRHIVDSLDCNKCMIKIGSVSFNALGHQVISYASNKGFKIFLDLKLHDIPNTVKKSIKGLVSHPIDMMTIHTSGGLEMMKAAKKAVDGTDIKVFGVTALTSLSDDDTSIIFKRTAAEQVNAMLDLAEKAKIDGIVCSPHELSLVSKRKSLQSITPGIRLKDLNDDQNRVMTPKDALKLGANFLVIGRPITEAKNIKDALIEIYNSI